MRLPDAACPVVRVAPFVWPKPGALGIDPRDIRPRAFPVLGVNRSLERHLENLNGVGDRGARKIEWYFCVDSPALGAVTRGFYLGIYPELTQEPNFTYQMEVFLWRRTGYGGFV